MLLLFFFFTSPVLLLFICFSLYWSLLKLLRGSGDDALLLSDWLLLFSVFVSFVLLLSLSFPFFLLFSFFFSFFPFLFLFLLLLILIVPFEEELLLSSTCAFFFFFAIIILLLVVRFQPFLHFDSQCLLPSFWKNSGKTQCCCVIFTAPSVCWLHFK